MKEFVVGSPYTTETSLGPGDEWLIVACDGVRPLYLLLVVETETDLFLLVLFSSSFSTSFSTSRVPSSSHLLPPALLLPPCAAVGRL
jgi:hypothetical protein